MKTSEILFTRQHHLADRAGDHYDIRLIIGDKAHSFATRKELPEPGKSIMLYETSIHTKDYALRKRIVIPPGNYGSGTTTLDFVRKANLIKNEDKGHFIMETTQGERYLLKPVSIKGQKTWLFKNLGEVKKDMQKEAASKKQKLFSRAVELYEVKSKSTKKKTKSMVSKPKKAGPKNRYLVKAASLLAGGAIEGHATPKFGIMGGAGATLIEPGSGILFLTKHIASIKVVKNNPIGKKVVGQVENPIKKGWEEGERHKDGLKSKLYEHLISPTSAHLQRTSAAISSVLKST